MRIDLLKNKFSPLNSKKIYEVEINGDFFVLIEDFERDCIGILPKRCITNYDELFRPDYYSVHVAPYVMWIQFLHFDSGGCADTDYKYLGDQYDYDVEEYIPVEIKNVLDGIIDYYVEDTYYEKEESYKELATFIVERYLRPFIEYGFRYDWDYEKDISFAKLSDNSRGILLKYQYGESTFYEDKDLVPCNGIQGFSNWCHLSIVDGKFVLRLCQRDFALCNVKDDIENIYEYMPTFLVYLDILELLENMRDMKEESK